MPHWFALSDPGMENALYEIESMRHFAGIKINAVPDETTILNFRRFIEDNDLSIGNPPDNPKAREVEFSKTD